VFCFAALAIWILSYFRPCALTQCVYLPVPLGLSTADFHPSAIQRFSDVALDHGHLLIAQSHRAIDSELASWGWQVQNSPSITIEMGPLGFAWPREKSPGWAYIRVVVPLWVLASCFAILPIAWGIFRRKIGPGGCRVCGYDLRATLERCPECGTVAETLRS